MTSESVLGEDERALELGQLRRLELASTAEAVTLLLLVLVAVPLKRLGGWDTGVRFMGPVHGLAFLTFLWIAVQTVADDPGRWRAGEVARLVLLAFVPFGGFLNLALIARKAASVRGRASTR